MKRLLTISASASGTLLILTGLAKVISSSGNAPILLESDPIFHLGFRGLFLITGAVEMVVGIFSVTAGGDKWLVTRLILLASMASSFCAYRVGTWWIHYYRPCPCLGILTSKIHLSSELADTISRSVAFFILATSYIGLIYIWKNPGLVSKSLSEE
jgi:hypothetical protein